MLFTFRSSSDRKNLFLLLATAFILIALTALWKWTPLSTWVNADYLVGLVRSVHDSRLTPLLVLLLFLISGIVMIPVTILILVSILVFGPLWGAVYSLAGSMISGVASFEIGRFVGQRRVEKIAGKQFKKINSGIRKKGLMTMIVVHALPIAPFGVVNLASGATRVRFRDFTLGTLIGMLPGILALSLFGNRLGDFLRNPHTKNWIFLLAVILALIVSSFFLKKWIDKKHPHWIFH